MRNLWILIMISMPYLIQGDSFRVLPAGRSSFLRNEVEGKLVVDLRNDSGDKLNDLKIYWKENLNRSLDELLPGKTARLELPVETRLKPGTYEYQLKVSSGQINDSFSLKIRIAPLKHDIMPMVSWGYSGSYKQLQEIGFTHGHSPPTRLSVIFHPGGNSGLKQEKINILDQMLADNFNLVDYYVVPHMGFAKNKFPRYSREGEPRFNNMEASNPEAVEMCRQVAAKAAEAFGEHPAFDALLINSEIRDYTGPSFGKYEPAAFRKYAGFDIPAEVSGKTGPSYSRIRNFPFNRIVPENYPLLVYYRWFWREGDGWNPLHTAINNEYKKRIKRPFWSFFDPAIRVPPLWGSGGNVDYLNTWSYAYPDPINAGAAISELQAMAKENPKRGVMSISQVICYRSQTAPIDRDTSNPPSWLSDNPKASFITLPPNSMRIAMWTQLSRHISGIMLHGFASLVQVPEHPDYRTDKGYQCTNMETRSIVSSIIREVIQPLGPVLKRIPERPAKVAVFESFASSILADRGSWGWQNKWVFDANLMLQWANLAPAVIYEETILRDGFEDIKVLLMPHCDVLPEPVLKEILEFQRNGGIIIADEFSVPDILPDIQIRAYSRGGVADKDKKILQEMAADIKKQLAGYYSPYVDSDDPDLLTWVRTYRDADYLFVINDKRTYGNYIGQYGMVMDEGLPNSGHIRIAREVGAVYDLVARKEVPFASLKDKITEIKVDFLNGSGRLFLLLPKHIDKINIEAPTSAQAGKPFKITVKVCDADGLPVEAVLPLQLTIFDAEDNLTDDSTFAAAEDGIYSTGITPPLNCKPGKWRVEVRELASGKSINQTILIFD